MRARIAAVVALAVACAGCASQPSQPGASPSGSTLTPNQRYLQDISGVRDPALSMKPVPLLGYGHEICADLDAGVPIGQVTILDSLAHEARAAVISAAVTDLCPQNRPMLERA